MQLCRFQQRQADEEPNGDFDGLKELGGGGQKLEKAGRRGPGRPGRLWIQVPKAWVWGIGLHKY